MTGTLHAMASSGGTVVCRALATHQKVLVLSEVSPGARRRIRFVPDTPLASLMASPLLAAEEREDLFLQQMAKIAELSREKGWELLIRDHPHSDFMQGDEPSAHSSLVRVMGDSLGARCILVRHPLDSFLSSRASVYLSRRVNNLEGYCRRLLQFDEIHRDLPRFTYEDFCADPEDFLPRLAERLGLPFENDWRARLADVKLSGNSGRSGDVVTTRSRRRVPHDVSRSLRSSPAFAELCRRWGYNDNSARWERRLLGRSQ